MVEFTDKDEWIAAVGPFTTIDFTGFPDGTFITDQYADLGVLFTGGSENIRFNDDSFPRDMWGLQAFQFMRLEFTTPQAWIAVEFPGLVQFELFLDGQMMYSSSDFDDAGSPGAFAGLVSDQLFDTVVIVDPVDNSVNIGDLYFGVPAPHAVAPFAIASLLGWRRRRQS